MIGALEVVARIKSGQTSALQTLHDTQAVIESRDHRLNCFTRRTFARAEREAAAIDAARAAGANLPPLAGVPYAVKNLYDIAGEVTLAGARRNARNAAATRDSVAVERLAAAGAVLLGALNMDEHAYGFTNENTYFGAVHNPHDVRRVAGGSSGGSAAAVAGGMAVFSLGTDTNGSIRVPASFCGLFGLKPTYGRLSRRGIFPFVSSLDHAGHFATSIADLAAVYDVMQGPDPSDPVCAQRAVEATSGALSWRPALRVGILGDWFEEWADAGARRAVKMAAEALGARQKVTLKSAELARAAAFIITAAEGGALHHAGLQNRYAEFEPASRSRLVAGNLIPAAWLDKAQRIRRQVCAEGRELFEKFDLLLAPATPVCAPLIGTDMLEVNGRSVPMRASLGLLTQPISFMGLPVCAAPLWPDAAHGGAGMPVGVQLIAAPWREDLCLAAGRALEISGVARVANPALDVG